MQDFAIKIITSGTTLAELGRDCHTQAMVCHPRRARCRSASALYTAPHVSPPRSCTRLRHRGIHIAPPACFGLPSICHILPLQARTQSAVQSYLSFVDRFGGEGAASEPGGFKASAGPPPAAGMLCCYSERCKGAPKAAEAFSATQRKANKNLRRCKVCIADQVGQLEKTLFGDECRHARQTTLTAFKVVAPIGPSAVTAAAVELSPSAQSTQALPPAWPAWRLCNLDKTLVYPSNANIQKVVEGLSPNREAEAHQRHGPPVPRPHVLERRHLSPHEPHHHRRQRAGAHHRRRPLHRRLLRGARRDVGRFSPRSPAWKGCAIGSVASGPFTCCRSGGATGKASLFAFKCPQPPAQSKQDCTTSMQEHQSRKRIKLGTDPIGLKRLRSVILVHTLASHQE